MFNDVSQWNNLSQKTQQLRMNNVFIGPVRNYSFKPQSRQTRGKNSNSNIHAHNTIHSCWPKKSIWTINSTQKWKKKSIMHVCLTAVISSGAHYGGNNDYDNDECYNDESDTKNEDTLSDLDCLGPHFETSPSVPFPACLGSVEVQW